MNESTVRDVLKRYHQNGNRVVLKVGVNNLRNKAARVLTGQLEEMLVSQQTLRAMDNMSMAARCARIEQVLRLDPDPERHIRVHRSQLKALYKRNGITRQRTRYVLGHSYTDETLVRTRQEFCRKLVDIMQSGREVLFFDETTVHSW